MHATPNLTEVATGGVIERYELNPLDGMKERGLRSS
jgi:hypothetical protein